MNELTTIQQLAVMALPVLSAITVHEAAHGYVARRLGDTTAMMMGRLTLNPLKHIDPIGTVLVPIAMFLLSGFLFGWAKPVPVNFRNLHHPRRDMALVAVAGPGANLLMAVFWGFVILLGQSLLQTLSWVAVPLIYMGAFGVLINALLMVLNLLPIPPLDGGRVLSSLLPPRMSLKYARLEPFGLILVLGLLVSGFLFRIIIPVVVFIILLLPGAPLVLKLFF